MKCILHSIEDNLTYENISTVSGGSVAEIKELQRPTALLGTQLLAKAFQYEGVNVFVWLSS